MNLILKLSADILFYLSFANFFASMIGLPIVVLWTPAALLTIWSIVSHFRNKTQFYDYAPIFMIYIKIFLPFAFFALVFARSYFEALSLLPAIGFFACAVALMRLSRQPLEKQKKLLFKLMALLPVIFTAIAAILFYAGELAGVLGSLLLSIYMNAIVPIILALLYVAMTILVPISEFLSQFINFEMPPILEILSELFGEYEEPMNVYEEPLYTTRTLDIFIELIPIIITLIILAIIIKLLFRHLGTQNNQTIWQQITESYIPKTGNSRPVRDPLRKQYRKFLRLCHKNGIAEAPFYTSADYARLAQVEGADKLRDIYIGVRYNNKKATQSEIAFAKRVCRRFAKSSKA